MLVGAVNFSGHLKKVNMLDILMLYIRVKVRVRVEVRVRVAVRIQRY
jgi:hypothetical protein